jgi:pentose-5-phosphate-3-epimerase
VEPALIPEALAKVTCREARQVQDEVEWVVDGGVTPSNVRAVRKAGADTVVVGRSLFSGGSVAANVEGLRAAAATDPSDAD